MVKKEQSQAVLKSIMSECEIDDITIEEDDIGNVVERIYADKREAAI
jgi:ABC-type uncharacterized transport system ATPase subunit